MINSGLPATVHEINVQAVGLFAKGDSDWITDDVHSSLAGRHVPFEQFATDYGWSVLVKRRELRQR